jgi:hypothetical protein
MYFIDTWFPVCEIWAMPDDALPAGHFPVTLWPDDVKFQVPVIFIFFGEIGIGTSSTSSDAVAILSAPKTKTTAASITMAFLMTIPPILQDG